MIDLIGEGVLKAKTSQKLGFYYQTDISAIEGFFERT